MERTKATLILIKMEVDDFHSEVAMLVNGFVQKLFSCELNQFCSLVPPYGFQRQAPAGAGKGRRLRGPESVPDTVTPFLLWPLGWVRALGLSC